MILSCGCPTICKECVREAEKRIQLQLTLHPEVEEQEDEVSQEETKKGEIQ